MNALLRKVAAALPEAWRLHFRRHFAWRWFRCSYSSWAEARAASSGYDDSAVLARVLAATRKVRAGSASWERDGWAFDSPELNLPLVSALRLAAEECGGKLDVVDFGGSLGSTWWQHRAALDKMAAVRWHVVEQPHYVAIADEFSNHVLTFHQSIDEALKTCEPMFVLFSSVLPYVEDPMALLAKAVSRGFRHIVIDRTPLVRKQGGRLAVQFTPSSLGGGSYPVWLFARDELLAPLRTNYALVDEWPAIDRLDPDVEHKGFHFRRLTGARSTQ